MAMAYLQGHHEEEHESLAVSKMVAALCSNMKTGNFIQLGSFDDDVPKAIH